jgi:hypothetical protein
VLAPLIGPNNVRPFETIWPVEKWGEPMAVRVCPASVRHVVLRRNCVLRRFSAKDVRCRLAASWFLDANDSGAYLAWETHISRVYHADTLCL